MERRALERTTDDEPLQIGAASLPHPLTSLVGRERELVEARALLDRGDVRLLTLTGPGGVGKTRVAITLAMEAGEEFAHGVRFVRLAAIRQPGLVGAAVAQALGVRAAGGRTAEELLPEVLRDQHLLLVLDNLEQVTGAAPWLGGLLAACPRLTVVATSRVALRLSGEQRFPIAPLPVPAVQDRVEPARLPEYAAVSLFLQRGSAVDPAFRLTEANAATVAVICRQLDGLPLALELAAARLGAFDVEALSRRLDRVLPLLTAGSADAPARLRTMRDAIAWSYDLLTPDEQALVRWLSVFLGGFPLDAAQAIGLALGQAADEVTERVAALVEQSLLRALPGERYGMLETIREFGLEQLAGAGEEARARDAHAAWVRELVAQAEVGLKGREQIVWLDRLEAERANIRAALVWLADHGAIEPALETASSLWLFWQIRGDFADARRQVEALLARPDAAVRTAGRANALVAAALLAGTQGDSVPAEAMHEEALAIFRERGEPSGLAWGLTTSGAPLWWQLDPARAARRLEDGLALYRDLGDRWHALRVIHLRAGLYLAAEDLDRAEVLLRDCQRGAAVLGDRWIGMLAAGDLAITIEVKAHWPASSQPLPAEVDVLLTGGGRLARELGDAHGLVSILVALGEFRSFQGRVEEAIEIWEEVRETAGRIGVQPPFFWALGHLGSLWQRQGQPRRAAEYLTKALAMTLDTDHQPGLTFPLKALAELALHMHHPEPAARLLGAIGRLLQARDEVLSLNFGAEFEHDVQQARAALNREVFQRAWAAGEAMSFADMLAAADALLQAAPAAPRPTFGLSPRELDVLKNMADGRSNQEIADVLFISLRTVTGHVTNILTKLGLPSRTAAVAFAIRAGLA